MKSDISIAQLKKFPQLMWVLLFGAFITRGSFYMVWPFLAVILYQQFGISAAEVGLILSGAALLSVFVGFIGGALSDLIGRHRLLFFSGVLYVFSFSLLAQVESLSGYVVVITLCSIAKALWEPPVSALIGDIIPEAQTRELALQMRYFLVNVGAALGPMIGVWIGVTGKQSSFFITAFTFAVLLLLLFFEFRRHGVINKSISHDGQKLASTWKILNQDKLLQCLIIANIICMFVYAQMDTTLIQYLTRAQVPELVSLISAMIFTNAMIIICCQFVLLKMMSAMALSHRIQIGIVLLAISQFYMAFIPVAAYWQWIVAVAIMSIAEAILFPTMNVHIDRIAPAHVRGAYFGAASFYSIGYAIAPLGGGLLLDQLGGQWVFGVGCLLCGIVIYMYHILDDLPRPDFEQLKLEKQ